MRLPGNEVGISDILGYRACPQEFAFGMRRHVELPERFALYPGERDEPPEHESYASAYGHAVHEAVELIENTDCADEFAIQTIMQKYTHWLEPADRDRMSADIEVWHKRRVTGFRLVGTELELKMPLFEHDGKMVYFRARVDVLYQHLVNPGYFYSRDYKSSRFAKTKAQVDADIQQWAYNTVIHYNYPECETLIQGYDQFRYGLIPTRKSDAQRETMRRWLIDQVKAILADDTLAPKRNDMCQFCPIMMDCRETHRSADYWVNRLGALAPVKKDGRKLVMELQPEVFGYEVYVDLLPKAKEAVKVLAKYIETVEGDLKEMDEGRREEFGYGLTKPKSLTRWGADAKRAIFERFGDQAMHVFSLSQTDVDSMFGKDSEEATWIRELADRQDGSPSLRKLKAS